MCRGGAEFMANAKRRDTKTQKQVKMTHGGDMPRAPLKKSQELLRFREEEKPDFCSSAFLFVLPVLPPPPPSPPPPPPSPPSFSNFPEDGGACLPGTWHWFPSALGNNLGAVARATRIYLFAFLHIAAEFSSLFFPPSPSFLFSSRWPRLTERRDDKCSQVERRWQGMERRRRRGRRRGGWWKRRREQRSGGWCVEEEDGDAQRDGWLCQAGAGRAVETLARSMCVLWGRVIDVCPLGADGGEGGQ